MNGNRAGLALMGLWLAACGSVRMEKESFDEGLSRALCERHVRCGVWSDAGACERALRWLIASEGLGPAYDTAIASGRLRYDEEAAGRCLDDLRNGSCEVDPLPAHVRWLGLGVADECRFLFGQVADGERCQWTAECGAGSFCTAQSQTGTCPGTCQPRLAKGMTSTVTPYRCAPGLTLIGSTCQELPGAGQPCQVQEPMTPPCAAGLYCQRETSICRRFSTVGETCDGESRPCAWNLRCEAGTCRRPGREGEGCSLLAAESPSHCQQGLFCDAEPGARGTCQRPRAAGAPCRDASGCEEEHDCFGANPFTGQRGTCQRYPVQGEGCAGSQCAESFYCERSTLTCQPRARRGEACQELAASTCVQGTFCHKGVCVAPRDLTCTP